MLGYIFKIDKIIVIQFTNYSNSIKSTYNSYITQSIQYKNTYLNQKNTIVSLNDTINKNNNYELLYKINQEKINDLEKIISIKSNELEIKYVEVLSYDNLNDFSKVILNINTSKDTSIKALATSDGYSAGIVVQEYNKVVAYLNPNEKCNYAVFIGDNLAPGITSGINENGEIIIKHIPIWHKVELNDAVITSGMDNIFPKGLKLGVVSSIKNNSTTKTIYIKAYKSILSNKYFYIINKK